MRAGAIDIHHHYVPEQIIGEAKRHGGALGVEVSEDKDGTLRFSFNAGPKYPLLQSLTDVKARFDMMGEGRIAEESQAASGRVADALRARADSDGLIRALDMTHETPLEVTSAGSALALLAPGLGSAHAEAVRRPSAGRLARAVRRPLGGA